MISHTDDRFMEIILKIGAEDIFKTARYVMQLEDLKQHANVMVDKVNALEFPFRYTGNDRPEEAVLGSQYLIRAIAEEQIVVEEWLRKKLVKVFADTRDLQLAAFGECLEMDPEGACKVVKNLKDRYLGDPREESDDEILEKIIYTLNLDLWLKYTDEDLKRLSESWDEDGEKKPF